MSDGWLVRRDISAILRLGSRRIPIHEIVSERPGIEPQPLAPQHYTTTYPDIDVKISNNVWIIKSWGKLLWLNFFFAVIKTDYFRGFDWTSATGWTLSVFPFDTQCSIHSYWNHNLGFSFESVTMYYIQHSIRSKIAKVPWNVQNAKSWKSKQG